MDAIEILGSLLGNKSKGTGRGADILKDIFGGGPGSTKRSVPPTRTSPSPSPSSSRIPESSSTDASDLEDLLHVAMDRSSKRSSAPTPEIASGRIPATQRDRTDTRSEKGELRSGNAGSNVSRPHPIPEPKTSSPYPPSAGGTAAGRGQQGIPGPLTQSQEATLLIRAMIFAAKADGQVSAAEQQSILQQLGDSSSETLAWIRQEFSRSGSARDLAWDVPLGMEEKIYALSLIVLELDTDSEARYLAELAQGLRLPPERCNQIHQRYGAPEIFRRQ